MNETDFVTWVEKELLSRNWSRADFARAGKLTTAQVTRVLNREQKPGEKFLSGTASALGVSIEQLLRLVGTLPDTQRDPWVDETSYKLSKIKSTDLREIVADIINTFAERERNRK